MMLNDDHETAVSNELRRRTILLGELVEIHENWKLAIAERRSDPVYLEQLSAEELGWPDDDSPSAGEVGDFCRSTNRVRGMLASQGGVSGWASSPGVASLAASFRFRRRFLRLFDRFTQLHGEVDALCSDSLADAEMYLEYLDVLHDLCDSLARFDPLINVGLSELVAEASNVPEHLESLVFLHEGLGPRSVRAPELLVEIAFTADKLKDSSSAVGALQELGETSSMQRRFETAALAYELAAAQLPIAEESATRVSLLVEAGRARREAGALEEARQVLTRAYEEARAIQPFEPGVEAQVVREVAALHDAAGRRAEADIAWSRLKALESLTGGGFVV